MKTLKKYIVPLVDVCVVNCASHLLTVSLSKSDDKVGDDYEVLSRSTNSGSIWNDEE